MFCKCIYIYPLNTAFQAAVEIMMLALLFIPAVCIGFAKAGIDIPRWSQMLWSGSQIWVGNLNWVDHFLLVQKINIRGAV